MAVPSSGAITLGKIYQEIDGSGYSNAADSGEEASLEDMSSNDTPDQLNSDGWSDSTNNTSGQTGSAIASTPYNMSEFRGYNQLYSAATFPDSNVGSSNWFETASPFSQEAPVLTWGNVNHTGPQSTAQASCQVSFKNDTTNTRIAMQEGNGNSGTGTSLNLHYVGYTGHSSTTFQAKCTYTTVNNSPSFGQTYQNPASYSPASGTYTNISTSSFSPTWFWGISNTGFSPTSLTSSSPHPKWHVRAGTSGTPIDGPGTGNGINLSAKRGTQGGPGGGDFCIHEDHKISTQDGLLTIDELINTCPKVWSWSNVKSEKELVDIAAIKKLKHTNLYKINNIKVTEDHVLYKENYLPVSVNPAKAKENYNLDSAEIEVGDKLMKFDGTLEEVTSIEAFSGTEWTYTILNKNGNFYADEILVDSEIKEPTYS